MRVLYDSVGLQEPVGGVSRYFVEMTKRLPDDIEPVISAVETVNEHLVACGVARTAHAFEDFLRGWRFPGKYRFYRLLSRWLHDLVPGVEETNLRAFKTRLDAGGWDLVHLTAPHRFGRELEWTIRSGVPYVMTVHDLIPEREVGWRRQDWRARALAHAAGIVAVSENTKDDLVRVYGLAPERIAVVYHGASGFKGPVSSAPSAFDLPEDYVLFVGKRGGYKNFTWMAEALKPLASEGIEVVATGGGKRYSDAELRTLYRGARCLVYPSRYEGFGLPILEAWQEGCPVVLSRASCFPEIGGDAALYFDLDDAEGLRQRVRQLGGRTEGSACRTALVARADERLARFAWERTAEETARVYRMVTHR